MSQTPILNFAHLCDTAFLSQDGKLNVIGIFKSINTAKLPTVHPKMTVALNMTVEGVTHLKIQILKKNTGETITKMQAKLEPPKGEEKEIGFFADINNTKFEEAGEYKLEIWINDNVMKETPFRLDLIKQKS